MLSSAFFNSAEPQQENSTPVKSTDSGTDADTNQGAPESDPNAATRDCYCQEGEHGQMVGLREKQTKLNYQYNALYTIVHVGADQEIFYGGWLSG